MLNKGLLLASGSKEKLDGIWEITVGGWTSGGTQYYGYGSQVSWGGDALVKINEDSQVLGTNGESFEPKIISLRTTAVTSRLNQLDFSAFHSPNDSDMEVYVHIKKPSGISSYAFYFDINFMYSFIGYPAMFTSSDVGNTYRVYIGNRNTPPLGYKRSSSNSSSYRRVA